MAPAPRSSVLPDPSFAKTGPAWITITHVARSTQAKCHGKKYILRPRHLGKGLPRRARFGRFGRRIETPGIVFERGSELGERRRCLDLLLALRPDRCDDGDERARGAARDIFLVFGQRRNFHQDRIVRLRLRARLLPAAAFGFCHSASLSRRAAECQRLFVSRARWVRMAK